jgi:hypothetical protein
VLIGFGVQAGAMALITLSDPWNESKALTWLGGSTYGRSFKHSVPMDDETRRVLGSRPPGHGCCCSDARCC